MQTTNEEVWEVKAKETWIDSFLSCHHQLPEKCNCPERRRELKMYIDKLLSTQEGKIRKEERSYLKHGLFNEYGELVMKVESATKAHEIAKQYNLIVKELY